MAAVEGVSKSVRSVEFSFLMDEEVRRMSVVKITKPILVDFVDRPVPGGLYDPLLGPYREEPCKTCGQRSFNCPGHCGHIELVLPAYNPLLVSVLYKLLQRICFSCYRLRTNSDMVKHYVSKLELIIKGDIAGAKRSVPPSESSNPEDSDMSHESCSTIYSPTRGGSDHLQQQQWSSLQFTEAMSVLNSLLKNQYKKCKNCKASNPRISNPNYGLFYLGGMSNADIRANVIEDCHLGELSAVDSEEITDVEDTIQTPGKKGMTSKKPKKEQDKAALHFRKQKNMLARKLLPSEVKKIIELFWEKEAQLCSYLSDIQQQRFGSEKAGSSMFFLQTILVPPIKFRPPTKGGDSAMEHPQTVLLNKVLQSNISLGAAYAKKEPSQIVDRWWELQQSINVLFDSKTSQGGSGQKDVASGICQILERKEGLFRQKMMGKRVNYACRSVISPDPYLDVNEIGIPPCFAVKLTYPERVTPWNAAQLRNAVINGSENHPGAIQYVDKLSTNRLPPNRKARISIARKLPSLSGAVTQPGKSSDYEYDGKMVYRHLRDGDIVLVNRQPTLHKISMMAHKVRVLEGEKTLRMHYANCSTYNADFDGDEMNVHFPQDEVSRAEAYNIVNANNQYVKPSNGEPIRGLIQDHIVSASLLTNMDSFLTGDQFVQLLHSSGIFGSGRNSFSFKPGQKVIFSLSGDDIQIPPPALSKPVDLWTGKQVITALLNHITKGHPPFTVEKGVKIPHDFFKSRANISCARSNETDGGDKASKETEPVKVNRRKKLSCEDKMFIKGNYLVQGVIDKAQFGEHGLVHAIHELYGSDTAGLLLSALSRLFTAFLQMHGFTCGVDDLLIMKAKDDERKNQLENCEKCGELVHRNFIGIKDDNIKIDPLALQLNIEKTIRSDGESALGYLDRQMTNELNSKTSSGVINELLSDGLLKASGKNCISLMTTSGAKGSKVNFQQISSFLGQQELEGKRVPRMVSGKTLPCFHPWDWDARAGGFIIDRFLTGLRPQEYYFHCMAGREGLVDTAVKTSRSGYLQRCLIKNLECLKISYDHTVRDADGSIVQFCYGDDGVDVHQTSFITKFDTLTANQEIICQKYDELEAFNSYIVEPTDALKEKAKKFLTSGKNEKNGELKKRSKELSKLVKQKYFSSLAQPGEPVGVLAAQSVGEPSTQMTLNTFHLAGRGEMNVTLGIPRLQEILMTASCDIKTPIMTCPLQRERTDKDANSILDKLKKVTVADVIESMEINVMPLAVQNDEICRIYKLTMKLYKPAHYPRDADISVEDWEETLEVVFVRQLEDAIQSHLVLLSRISGIKDLPETHSSASNETDEGVTNTSAGEENDDENDEMVVDDIGLDAEKRRLQLKDDREYDDDEEQDEDENESSALENETDPTDTVASEDEISKDDIIGTGISESPGVTNPHEPESRKKASKSKSQHEYDSKQKSSDGKLPRAKRKKRVRANLIKKDFDRAIFVEAKGFDFRIHFKFTNEPHILLAEIAQKTATKVYIQNPGKIERCRVTNCKENQVIYYGEDPKKRVDVEPAEKEKTPALHTTGVDFSAFWQMEDQLDLRYLYSNDIHAMLKTYGVEAARETIIREVKHVFGSYGISVNTRHLSLIADFMTHTGGYRPMSRLGGIAESISPFCKMSFETASKFIVKAALHGESDNLEAPSASICLGLPVKMGTGSFGLMQKLEI